MFAETRVRIPNLSAWMESCCSCQPFLLLGKDSIRSCCGVQRGSSGATWFRPDSPPPCEIKAEILILSLNAWYLDDGTLMGCPQDLASALHIIERMAPLDLHLQAQVPPLPPEDADESISPLPPDIPVTRRGFSLLGCPIGPPDFCEGVFQARLSKVKVS